MASLDEILDSDALGQAEFVKKGEVSALELVEAAISRVEKTNPDLNAVITPLYDRARKEASGNIPDGPFSGLPFFLKDLGAMSAGDPMSLGTGLLKGFVPDHDSELFKRYKKAGLLLLGKTNTPEFGLLPTTEPAAFGVTKAIP